MRQVMALPGVCPKAYVAEMLSPDCAQVVAGLETIFVVAKTENQAQTSDFQCQQGRCRRTMFMLSLLRVEEFSTGLMIAF